jgi:hypothetical protein
MSSHSHVTNQGSYSHTQMLIDAFICCLVSFLANIIARSSFRRATGSLTLARIDGLTEGVVMGERPACVQEGPGEEKSQRRSFSLRCPQYLLTDLA